MKPVWQRFFTEDGILIYEGYAVNGKAYGLGTSYYRNGMPLHEGFFGIKGLLMGKEYYHNGQVRFEGVFTLNGAYGPNAPEYGTWYNEQGKELFHGKFWVDRGGVGYPKVKIPEGYGTPSYGSNLENHLFMWEDEKSLTD